MAIARLRPYDPPRRPNRGHATAAPPKTEHPAMRLQRLYLALNLPVYFGFSLGYLLWPRALATRLDIALGSPTALADLTATYGGLSGAMGAFMLLGMLRPQHTRGAVLVACLGSAGLLLGRTLSLTREGPPSPYLYATALSELIGVSVGLWLLSRNGLQKDVSPPHN